MDTGDAMSPELSRETRIKLCALTTMLSSYQVMRDTDVGIPTPHTLLQLSFLKARASHRLWCLGSSQVLGLPRKGEGAPSW